MLHRRTLLRGLFAMPAVVAASSLMSTRGIPLYQCKVGDQWEFVACDSTVMDLASSGIIEADLSPIGLIGPCEEHANYFPCDPPLLKKIVIDRFKYRDAIDKMVRELEG